jgi:hypothetical protein
VWQATAVHWMADLHHNLTISCDPRLGHRLRDADLPVRLPNLSGLRYAHKESAGTCRPEQPSRGDDLQ